MFLLLLLLSHPDLADRVTQAWLGLGIQGVYALEGAGCQLPTDRTRERGPTGFLSFAHLIPPGRVCTIMLLALVDSLAAAERAAGEVNRIAAARSERHPVTLLAVPVAAHWSVLPGASTGEGATTRAGDAQSP